MIDELKNKLKKRKFKEVGTNKYFLYEEDPEKTIEVLNEIIQFFIYNENSIEKTHDYDDECFQFMIDENNVENYVYLHTGRNGIHLQITQD